MSRGGSMTIGMFIFLLIWIAICTSKKDEKKSFLSDITIVDESKPVKDLRDYGKPESKLASPKKKRD
jgi:hypothetical protein